MNSYDEAIFTGFGFVLLLMAFAVIISIFVGIASTIAKIRVYNEFSKLLKNNREVSEKSRDLIRLFCSRKTKEDDRVEIMKEVLKEANCKNNKESQ